MKQIKINISYFKLYITITLISLFDLFFTDTYGTDSKNIFVLIQIIMAIVFLVSYFIQKKSSIGFFVNKNGFVLKNSKTQFDYLWETINVRVVLNLLSFTVIEVSTNKNPKYKIFISYLMDREGMESVENFCPKDHALYKFFKKYSKS